VAKLLELIQCYDNDLSADVNNLNADDNDTDNLIALGQVYGFRVIRPLGQEQVLIFILLK
jgi:hypothetical protein